MNTREQRETVQAMEMRVAQVAYDCDPAPESMTRLDIMDELEARTRPGTRIEDVDLERMAALIGELQAREGK